MMNKLMPSGCKGIPIAEIYTQAIHWERVRAIYWFDRGNLPKATDATERADHYQAVLSKPPFTKYPRQTESTLPPTSARRNPPRPTPRW